MTIEEAADKLMATYARFGIDRREIVRLMRSGIENYDLTIGAVFNGCRMMLSEQFHTRIVFAARYSGNARDFRGRSCRAN